MTGLWTADDPEGGMWLLIITKHTLGTWYSLERMDRSTPELKGKITPSDLVLEKMLQATLDHYQLQSIVVLLFLRDWITRCYNE
jgi:uncharacterized membrane protein